MLTKSDKPQYYVKTRLEWGEAWMICMSCNSKLYSFDGTEDKFIERCPYRDQFGECSPIGQSR